MNISSCKVGDIILMGWNHELIQIVEKWGMCTKIKSLERPDGSDSDGATREVSNGCEVEPYEGQFDGRCCACGCGQIVTDKRKDAMYATSNCRLKVFRKKGE